MTTTPVDQTITAKFDDAEERALVDTLNCIFHAKVSLSHIALARGRQGSGDVEDLELVQDQFIDMQRGFTRQLQRRREKLAALAGNTRLAAGGAR